MKDNPLVRGLAHLLIGQPNLAEALTRALALKGSPPQYVQDTVGVSIEGLSLRDVEFLWLQRTMRLSFGIGLPAVAAQFAQCALTPTAGALDQSILCLCEKIIFANTTAGALNYCFDLQPVAGLANAATVPKSALDDRAIPFNALQPTPAYGVTDATGAVSITQAGRQLVAVPAGSSIVLDVNMILSARRILPGVTFDPASIVVSNTTLNSPLNVGFIWRERKLMQSEK